MKVKTKTIAPVIDRDGIAQAQTTAGATALTLNGALGTSFSYPVKPTLYSSGNLSGRTFTIVGKDERGQTQSENVTGPNNSTVEATKYYSEFTSITPDAAVGTNVEVGVNGELVTNWIPHDNNISPFNVSHMVSLSSGANLTYSIEHTLDDLQNPNSTINALEHGSLRDLTASSDGNYDSAISGSRLKVKSFTSGSIVWNSLQAG